MANSADPDQAAPRGAVRSGSSLFAIPFASLEKMPCSLISLFAFFHDYSKHFGRPKIMDFYGIPFPSCILFQLCYVIGMIADGFIISFMI